MDDKPKSATLTFSRSSRRIFAYMHRKSDLSIIWYIEAYRSYISMNNFQFMKISNAPHDLYNLCTSYSEIRKNQIQTHPMIYLVASSANFVAIHKKLEIVGKTPVSHPREYHAHPRF